MRSPLSDGEWHRLHPLTPLLRGGLFLVVIAGIVIANLRDRLVVPLPALARRPTSTSDDDVEELRERGSDRLHHREQPLPGRGARRARLLLVADRASSTCRGASTRSASPATTSRCAAASCSARSVARPLDRVQGVNLTRPMIARLLGMAKLEVVGAGTGRQRQARVPLDRERRGRARRHPAARLGRRRRRRGADRRRRPRVSRGRSAAAPTVSRGASPGSSPAPKSPVAEPESVVHIPVGRLVASHAAQHLDRLAHRDRRGDHRRARSRARRGCCSASCPALIGFGAYWVRSITRSLRYSIAPTPTACASPSDCSRRSPRSFRPAASTPSRSTSRSCGGPFGWWRIRINRLSGRGRADDANDQFTTVLPVGTRADVERVLRLLLPGLPESEWPLIVRARHPRAQAGGDPFTNTPRRAWLLRPLSWRRNGFRLRRRAAAAPRRDLAQARGPPARAAAEHRASSRGRSIGCCAVASIRRAHGHGPCAGRSASSIGMPRSPCSRTPRPRRSRRLERPQPPVGGRRPARGPGARRPDRRAGPTPRTEPRPRLRRQRAR